MEEKHVEISEFPIHKVPPSCTWIVIGPPGSGKTSFIEWLCYVNKHKYPTGRVWCGTEDTQGKYGKFIKPLYITNDYNRGEHEKCVTRQKMSIAEGCQNAHCIYILDDCNTDRKVFADKLMRAQFKNGAQWWNCMFIIGSHYVFDMPPDIRKCVWFVAIFREPSVEERQKLWKTLAAACTFDEFNQLMDELTGDHTCLIFKKTGQSNRMEDCIFYCKAQLVGNWELGCEEYKKWSLDRYNKNYVENYA